MSSGPPVKLRVEGMTKRYRSAQGEPVCAVCGVSFEVAAGQVLALLGPSGCGKTTMLRLIAGFERPDEGVVMLDGRPLNQQGRLVRPEARDIGFVFQDLALFPHLSVLGNVMFGLRRRRMSRENAAALATDTLRLLDLEPLAHRMPAELSGGQQQRVAVARAMAPAPRIILLDEPFSGLDAGLRQEVRDDVRSVLARQGMTAILVTHDQDEALSFADRVGVMRHGSLVRIGDPAEVYRQPHTAFVARFLGRTNVLEAKASGCLAETVIGPVRLTGPCEGERVVSMRPEHLDLTPPTQGLPVATVHSRRFQGHELIYTLDFSGQPVQVLTDFRCAFQPGDRVSVRANEPAVEVVDDREETSCHACQLKH